MTRDTMASAIRMGLRRSAGKDTDAQADSVLMAIEMAMELQRSGALNGSAPPPKESASTILDSGSLAPPPNPRAMQDGGPVEVFEQEDPEPVGSITDSSPSESPAPHPPPPAAAPPPPSDNLVVLASNESDITRAAKEASRPKVRSVFMRGGVPKVQLEDVMGWIVKSFPIKLAVTPHGVDQEIELQRKVYAIPCQGDGRKNPRESVAKICYNHPKLDSTMEVGIGIRVGDVIDRDYPTVESVIEQITKQAVEMYKKRPDTIEGRAPTGPDLYGAHRQISRVLNDPNKMQGAQRIKFKDADEPLQYPELDK